MKLPSGPVILKDTVYSSDVKHLFITVQHSMRPTININQHVKDYFLAERRKNTFNKNVLTFNYFLHVSLFLFTLRNTESVFLR